MPHVHGDFLDVVEREIVAARRDLARRADRVSALVELHARALDVSARLQRALKADDVFGAARNEVERAELQALADRILSSPGAELAEETPAGAPGLEGTGAGL